MADLIPLPARARDLGNVPALNRALAASADWPKTTLDLPASSAEELRHFLLNRGVTIEKFKSQPIYRAALASGRYPWLSDL